MRRRETPGDTRCIINIRRQKECIFPLFVFFYVIMMSSVCVVSNPEQRSGESEISNLPSIGQQRSEESISQKPGNGGVNNGKDDSNGILQIIESEVWDASESVWKGATIIGAERGNRWTNEKGQVSPSPAEIIPPDGWEFLGDWKIVVSSSSINSAGVGGGVAGGDSKGWEYQFQYLQPPRRRRIWLRGLTPIMPTPLRPKSDMLLSRIVPEPSSTSEHVINKTKEKKIQRSSRFVKIIRQIQDDWNYKGLGFNLYKSLVFPSSIGVAVRLPLSINFDTFDRNPAWPIISSSAAVFYPPMVAGLLSTSVHVEWVKWMIKCTLGLIPQSILWVFYRLVLPSLWLIASVMLFPLKDIFRLPPCPTKIPNEFWWTGRNIMKPQYNSEMSERIGCSVSYRWSKKRGYEWRVNYWHSYLPKLSVYQQLLSQLQGRFKYSIASESDNFSSSSVSPSQSSSASLLSKKQSKAKTNWWMKHTASLGVSTSGPIPDIPPITCSANLSLSGLYLGPGKVTSRKIIKPFTVTKSSGSRTNGMMQAMDESIDDEKSDVEKNYEDITKVSNRIRTAPIKASSSIS